MNFALEFDAGNKLFRVSIQGVLTDETLAELTAQAQTFFQSQMPDIILVDLSGVTDFQVSSEVARSFAQQPSLVPREVVRVVIAPQDLIFGVTRMFQSYADGMRPNVYVVRSLEEAYKYLRLPHRRGQSA